MLLFNLMIEAGRIKGDTNQLSITANLDIKKQHSFNAKALFCPFFVPLHKIK